jgi:NAD-dependent DNA ligase
MEDGTIGQKSDEHYKLIGNHLQSNTHLDILRSFNFTYGEVMMSKSTFLEKYSTEFANPRNLVVGLLNSKDAIHNLVTVALLNMVRSK